MRQVRHQRAATHLVALALVTGSLASRLENARQRIFLRRQKMRRRIAGVFRTVYCLGRCWRHMRVQRRERAIRALRLGSLIAVRTKRWLSQTRKRIEGARAERRRAEAEEEIKKQKEEAERKLLESGLSAAQAARVEMLQL